MRALPILSTLAMVLAVIAEPFSGALPMPAPSVEIDIVPSDEVVDPDANNSTVVDFRVDVGVSKMPRQQVTVTLTASADTGWYCTIEPSRMEFTDLALDQWIGGHCCVTVPAGISNMGAELTVNGTAISGGLQATATSRASLWVNAFWYPPANQTGNETNLTVLPATGGNATSINASKVSDLIMQLTKNVLYTCLAGAVVILVVVVAVAYVLLRKRKRQEA